jgi:hypothetical protein
MNSFGETGWSPGVLCFVFVPFPFIYFCFVPHPAGAGYFIQRGDLECFLFSFLPFLFPKWLVYRGPALLSSLHQGFVLYFRRKLSRLGMVFDDRLFCLGMPYTGIVQSLWVCKGLIISF